MKDFFAYTDDNISILYKHEDIPKEEDFKLHTHEEYELYYFIDGSGVFKIEGNPYSLQSGDILIMRSAEAHFIDIDISKPYTRVVINFKEDLYASLDEEGVLLTPFNNRRAGELNLYRSSDFRNLKYEQFLQGIYSDAVNQKLQVTSNLFALLNEIFIAFNEKSGERSKEKSINEVIKYINNNLYGDISLNKICSIFYMSKQQLCRSFKRATGSTVWEYITAKRLLFARSLIASGVPATDACNKSGFSDYSTFFRSYKKRYHVSPTNNLGELKLNDYLE